MICLMQHMHSDQTGLSCQSPVSCWVLCQAFTQAPARICLHKELFMKERQAPVSNLPGLTMILTDCQADSPDPHMGCITTHACLPIVREHCRLLLQAHLWSHALWQGQGQQALGPELARPQRWSEQPPVAPCPEEVRWAPRRALSFSVGPTLCTYSKDPAAYECQNGCQSTKRWRHVALVATTLCQGQRCLPSVMLFWWQRLFRRHIQHCSQGAMHERACDRRAATARGPCPAQPQYTSGLQNWTAAAAAHLCPCAACRQLQ